MPLPPGADVLRVTRAGRAPTLWTGRAGEGFTFRARQPGPFTVEGTTGARECFFNPDLPVVSPERVEMPALDRVDPSRVAGGRPPPGWLSRLSLVVWLALAILLLEWTLYHRGLL